MTAPAPSPGITRGTLLGERYVIEERIARGGVGEVWAATDKKRKRQVAVKTLRSFYKDHDEVRARFLREGELLKRIDSPYVCKLLDVCVEGVDEPFLVFERLHGDSLDRVLKGGAILPLHEVSGLIDEIFSGLVAAHAVGVVHRDLKPANVFVVDERPARGKTTKLIDFGISKLLSGDGPSLTTATATLGSPQYMAPEQLGNAASADERCDTYAAATIAFRALTGTLPFDPKDAVRLLVLKQRSHPATLEEVAKRPWPASLQEFFDCTLARDREDRPRTAALAQDEWRSACAEALAAEKEDGQTPSSPSASPTDSSGLEDEETPVLSRRGPRR